MSAGDQKSDFILGNRHRVAWRLILRGDSILCQRNKSARIVNCMYVNCVNGNATVTKSISSFKIVPLMPRKSEFIPGLLPSYYKAAQPVLIIFKMVSYVPEIRLKSRFKELIVGCGGTLNQIIS